MIINPFARKPKTPLEQALDVVESVRADAAETAASIRDAAARAADALGEPSVPMPVPSGRRLPAIALVAAAGLGVALAIRARAGGAASQQAPETPRPAPAAATAAKATATEAAAASGEKPAAEVPAEKPKEPRAETGESAANSS